MPGLFRRAPIIEEAPLENPITAGRREGSRDPALSLDKAARAGFSFERATCSSASPDATFCLELCEVLHRLARASASTDVLAARERNQPDEGETIMRNVERIHRIADNHAQTVQVCIDRLHELGGNEQLKVLTGKLQRLAVRATPGDGYKAIRAARRERRRP
jgi:hypothetical protein